MSSIAHISSEISMGFVDYPSPEDHSINLFIYGCSNHCKGCSNMELQLSENGVPLPPKTVFRKILEKSISFRTRKICLLGGDPLFPKNIKFTQELLLLLQDNDFDVCLFTGYSITTVKSLKISGFKFVKTGKFRNDLRCKSEKTDDYIQFASSNQKLYDKDLNLLSQKGRYYFNNK
jgi:organic radical activating enzyme